MKDYLNQQPNLAKIDSGLTTLFEASLAENSKQTLFGFSTSVARPSKRKEIDRINQQNQLLLEAITKAKPAVINYKQWQKRIVEHEQIKRRIKLNKIAGQGEDFMKKL